MLLIEGLRGKWNGSGIGKDKNHELATYRLGPPEVPFVPPHLRGKVKKGGGALVPAKGHAIRGLSRSASDFPRRGSLITPTGSLVGEPARSIHSLSHASLPSGGVVVPSKHAATVPPSSQPKLVADKPLAISGPTGSFSTSLPGAVKMD